MAALTVCGAATAKYLRGSPRKTRLVTRGGPGQAGADAPAILRSDPEGRRAGGATSKSATANAENNHNLSAEDLIIATLSATRALRSSASGRARGPSNQIHKPRPTSRPWSRPRRPGMGQKVHPTASVSASRAPGPEGYADDREYTASLQEDIKIRQQIDNRLANAGVTRVEIERGTTM